MANSLTSSSLVSVIVQLLRHCVANRPVPPLFLPIPGLGCISAAVGDHTWFQKGNRMHIAYLHKIKPLSFILFILHQQPRAFSYHCESLAIIIDWAAKRHQIIQSLVSLHHE